MARTLPLLALLAVVTASGAVQGVLTGRWSGPGVIAARVAELRNVPMAVGDWRGRELVLDGRAVEAGDLAGYVMRRYENGKGDALTLLIVCGRPGPVAAHTPEVCYGGSGYEQVAPATEFAVAPGPAGRPDGFWSVDFRKEGKAVPECLRVFYSWNRGAGWTSSGNPRVHFAGAPVLDKMYVVRQTGAGAGPTDVEVVTDFLGKMLPELRRCLFTAPGSTPASVPGRK